MLMKIVVDVNVMVSALFWKGAPAAVIALVEAQQVALFTRPEMLAELEQVLSREKFAAYLAEQAWVVSEAVGKFALLATVVTPNVRFNLCRDPEDNAVLECALEANADYIVSGDKDLLVLREFEGIPILSPAQFLRLPRVCWLRLNVLLCRFLKRLHLTKKTITISTLT
jgi:putative PIN family toxin of toxin-antitoxin system